MWSKCIVEVLVLLLSSYDARYPSTSGTAVYSCQVEVRRLFLQSIRFSE